jgi:eukaryotic-like serine/threonine-protein kinase
MAPSQPPPPSSSRVPPLGGPPIAFGKYLLERRLAVGGTSEVFLARARAGDASRLVIKRLLPAYLSDPSALGMFATEARLHRAVHHPNVVEVYEAGVVGGEPYLAMEYVDGVDLFRMLRRAQTESRQVPIALAVHIARALCDALDSVHNAKDESGVPLGVIHRDVTPSNIYLSLTGDVRLGDFGIARTLTGKASRASLTGAIKGKYGYLAPEQVCGEPCDHRADLFSLAVVTSEIILGRPLFPGSGQLAVLLAIRDGRIDALVAEKGRLPPGLYDVLARALARDPATRTASARELGDALAGFEGSAPEQNRDALREWVSWSRDTDGLAKRLSGVLRESSDRMKAVVPALDRPPVSAPPTTRRVSHIPEMPAPSEEFEPEPVTARFDEIPSRIRRRGKETGPINFARIIQMIVTGELGAEDEVDLMGQGFRKVTAIELLERHLPDPHTTRTVERPSPPDMSWDLASAALLDALGSLYRAAETGLLLVEGRAPNEDSPARREIYLKGGTLFHVGSPEASELLGQSLVRRGIINTEELDMALAVLSKFDGRLGDTLIGLGLVDAVQIFRAIEEQGKERILRLFAWDRGRAGFYRGVLPARVEFPLETDLAELFLAGAEIASPGDTTAGRFKEKMGWRLRRVPRESAPKRKAPLPKPVVLVFDAIGGGLELRQVLLRLATTGALAAADALRAVEVGIALGVIELV